MTAKQDCFSYNKYLQPTEKDKPEINLKQSPLALLAQTCSSIESNLTSCAKPTYNIDYKPVLKHYKQVKETLQSKTRNSSSVALPRPDEGKPKTPKGDKKLMKRSSSSCSPASVVSSPKKQKLNEKSTPPSIPERASSECLSNLINYPSLNHPTPSYYQQNDNLLKQAQLQMQMMNPMHYYMKTIEDQLKSSQHVCNWMVNNVTCGKKFSTSDQLYSHLQTHAMTSQPSYPPISSLQTNQMLQSAYSILQNHQNQLASVNFAGQNNLSGVPVFNPFAKYLHGNLPMLPTSATTVSPYCLPFSNVFS